MLQEDILKFFARYIESELGIVYENHNYFQLQNRLEEIGKTLGTPIEELYALSQAGMTSQFRQLLLDTATNNETSFFRDPKIFKAIEKVLLEPQKSNSRAEERAPLRIWSAASSSGQEALSTAMLIKEFCREKSIDIPFLILASDISSRVLEKAKLATYIQIEVERGLSESLLSRYFRQDKQGTWTAIEELQRHIEYQRINLTESFSFAEDFDLVLCRNVLIYQSIENKKAILSKIAQQMRSGAFLVLGAGESLFGLSDDFRQVAVEGAILYQKA